MVGQARSYANAYAISSSAITFGKRRLAAAFFFWSGEDNPKNAKWEISGKEVGLPDLRAALSEYWKTVSNKFPGVDAIEVILIDLTARDAKSQS